MLLTITEWVFIVVAGVWVISFIINNLPGFKSKVALSGENRMLLDDIERKKHLFTIEKDALITEKDALITERKKTIALYKEMMKTREEDHLDQIRDLQIEYNYHKFWGNSYYKAIEVVRMSPADAAESCDLALVTYKKGIGKK